MSNIDDKDDWSSESASLFRESRRGHDPTPAESARLSAVLARIQAGKADISFAANAAAESAAPATLRLVGGVSLGVVCLAAATFAFVRVSRPPSEPARSARPLPTAVAGAPQPIAMQPAPVPAHELNVSAQTPAAPAEPRSPRQRPRASAERQRTPRTDKASAPEATHLAGHDESTNVSLQDIPTRQERSEPEGAVEAAAALQQTKPRPTAFESSPRETVTTAPREADSTQPQAARTEIAMMKRIQDALRETDFATVLTLCAEHARRWPRGVFALEREGVRAIASCGENSDDAALRATRFLTTHPHASVAMRVKAACAAQLVKR